MQKDNIAIGIVIGVLLVSLIVLFCALIIKLYIHKIKTYTRIIYEKDLNYQKSLNTTIMETQEQVLNNISRDLHDDAGQQLTYINFMVENLKLDAPELTDALEPVSNSVRLLSNSIRSISHSLNNQLLMQQDLAKAIEAEVLRLQKNSRIQLNFVQTGNNTVDFDTNHKIVIYRIFQEAINNIFKHAAATSIDITLVTEPRFELVIRDNGKGFDYQTALQHSSLGLKNILNRAEIINFDVEIASSTGRGTTIKLFDKAPLHG